MTIEEKDMYWLQAGKFQNPPGGQSHSRRENAETHPCEDIAIQYNNNQPAR